MELSTYYVLDAYGQVHCREGTIVGTLAWNTYRHMECWYGNNCNALTFQIICLPVLFLACKT